MSGDIPQSAIEAGVRALINASTTSLGTEVVTPVIYPNGECVIVLVAAEANGYVVHDAGLGAMYLEREGVRPNRDISARLSIIARRYHCDLTGGRVSIKSDANDVPVSVMLVANASRGIGDLAAEIRRQSDVQFRYILTERVREIAGGRLRENETFRGKSGTPYRVSNTILDDAGRDPIAFIVPLASRGSVATQFKELFDLREAFPNIVRESVYDEDSDFRPAEDGWVLSQVGEVVPFGEIRTRLPFLLSRHTSNPSFPH